MADSPHNLNRKLGFFPVYNIVVANIIGAGIFTTSGLLMESLGNVIFMLSIWLIGGLVALCGAVSYSELGMAMPKAGGEYVFLSKLYGPVWGFLSGWVSFIAGFSAPIAASAIGFSEYFCSAFPHFQETVATGSALSLMATKKLIAIAVIALFTAIHACGLMLGSKIQNVLTVLKIGLLIALVAAGFLFGKGDWEHFRAGSPFTFDMNILKNGGVALLWVMFAYSGWNAATYIGSEVRNPRRNIPRALILGTLTVVAVYLLLNLFFVYAIPPDDMKGVVSIGSLAAHNAFGARAETLVSLLISFALFSSLSAYLIIGPRVYYAMSNDGYFFKSLSKVTPKNRVPARAIIMQGALSIIIVISGTFEQIITYMGFALLLFPMIAVAGNFKLRRQNNHSRMKGFPFVQIIFLSASLIMLIFTFCKFPWESVLAILTVLIGIPVFLFFRKKRIQ